MASPPRPGADEVTAAVTRIRARHDRVDDPHRAEMGTEPAEVLAYLRYRWATGTPRATALDDIWDELVLSAAVHWAEIERRRALLRRARHLGLSLAELGAHHGIGTRQGMRDYLDRLDAMVDAGVPDEKRTRDARRAARARPAHQRWLDDHRSEITAALHQLVDQVDRVLPSPALHDDPGPEPDEELEWLDELRLEVQRDDLTPATMAILSQALGELRAHHAVSALDRGHGVHRALRDAERARARYDGARVERHTHADG